MNRCSRCGGEKLVTEFAVDELGGDGVYVEDVCRDCEPEFFEDEPQAYATGR